MPSSFSEINTGSSASSAFNFVINAVKAIFVDLDHIVLLGSFSLLDLFLAILAMGIIISVLISSVPNFALNSYDFSVRSEEKAIRDKEKAEWKKYRKERSEYYKSKRR